MYSCTRLQRKLVSSRMTGNPSSIAWLEYEYWLPPNIYTDCLVIINYNGGITWYKGNVHHTFHDKEPYFTNLAFSKLVGHENWAGAFGIASVKYGTESTMNLFFSYLCVITKDWYGEKPQKDLDLILVAQDKCLHGQRWVGRSSQSLMRATDMFNVFMTDLPKFALPFVLHIQKYDCILPYVDRHWTKSQSCICI